MLFLSYLFPLLDSIEVVQSSKSLLERVRLSGLVLSGLVLNLVNEALLSLDCL